MALIDNDNTSTSYFWYMGGDGAAIRRVAQSFQLGSAATIGSVTFRASLDTGSSFNIRVRIETNSGSAPSGTLVDANAEKIIAGTATGGSSVLHTATFDSTFNLSSGTTYWIVLKKETESSTNNRYAIYASNTSTYATYNLASYNGSWSAQVNDDMYFTLSSASVSYTATPSALNISTDEATQSILIYANSVGVGAGVQVQAPNITGADSGGQNPNYTAGTIRNGTGGPGTSVIYADRPTATAKIDDSKYDYSKVKDPRSY